MWPYRFSAKTNALRVMSRSGSLNPLRSSTIHGPKSSWQEPTVWNRCAFHSCRGRVWSSCFIASPGVKRNGHGLKSQRIKDGCLKRGWSTLMFVQLDKTSKLPVWLPHTHVRFVLEGYGIDQLVGAIKARVQEQGGTIAKPDALSRARRIQHEAEFLKEKQRLFQDRAWIEQTVQRSVAEATQRAVESGGNAMQPPPVGGTQNLFCVITDGRVSVAAGWTQAIFNHVGQEAYVFIREFRGPVSVPGSRQMYMFRPELLKERKLTVQLTAMHELAWIENGKKELLSTEELAHTIAMAFFDLVGKVNRGEIEMPFA
jgi:hypothetical protein